MSSVLAFGELLFDRTPGGDHLGGAPANVAFHLAARGVPVSLVSRVGYDPLGALALETLAKSGVDLSLVQLGNEPTGTVDVTLTDGNAQYEIHPGVAYDNIEVTASLLAAASKASLICFGTLVQRTPFSRATLETVLDHASNAIKLLDINLRRNCYSPEIVEHSLQRANIVKLNDSEVIELSQMLGLRSPQIERAASEIVERFQIDSCLITLAERGMLLVSPGRDPIHVPGYRVNVVDTIGAGDAFTAAFISRFLQGESLVRSVEYGNRLGALVASRAGAMPTVSDAEIACFAGEQRSLGSGVDVRESRPITMRSDLQP